MAQLLVWSSTSGDVLLTQQLLSAILGGAGIVDTGISTVGAGTLTAAALTGGQITRSGPTGAFTDTTDTATNIVAALGSNFNSGQSFLVRIKNTTIYTETLAAGAGVTLPGTILVPPLSVGNYFATVGGTAASPTVTFSHISTVPIHEAAGFSDPQASALTTVGAGTVLAAGVNAGFTTRGGTQIAAFTDTTDTAANLIAGVSALANVVGSSVEWTYVNNTIFPATLAQGSGVTLSGATVIPANSWAKYLVTYTGAGAVSMVCVAQGYFPSSGTFIANGSTAVTVSNAAVTAGSVIAFALKTIGGTPAGAPFLSSVTPGAGFNVKAVAGDTSTYNYAIFG